MSLTTYSVCDWSLSLADGVIPAEAIPRCQQTWLELEQPARASFDAARSEAKQNGIEHRTFFDVGNLCNAEDAFIDLVDNPVTLPLMSLLCGHGGTTLERNQTVRHPTHTDSYERILICGLVKGIQTGLCCVRAGRKRCLCRRWRSGCAAGHKPGRVLRVAP